MTESRVLEEAMMMVLNMKGDGLWVWRKMVLAWGRSEAEGERAAQASRRVTVKGWEARPETMR